MSPILSEEIEHESTSGPVETSDQSLVLRFQNGCNDAATQIYLRYAKRLRSLIGRRCSEDLAARFDADDVVQSVFRSFFQAARRGHYQVPAGEELWKILLVIALNKLRNEAAFHRAARRDVRLTASEANGPGLDSLERDDFAYVFLRLAIDEALERMPVSHRQMIELRIQGHEVAQIAAATGRSKRTVERILQEVRQQLALHLP